MVAILVAHPHNRNVDAPTSPCQRSEAPLDEVDVMTDKDEQPDAGVDDFDKAARLNFRDYPSTSLVMFAALSSGLGWVLYKWLGRKRADQRAVPNGDGETVGNAPEVSSPTDESARGGAAKNSVDGVQRRTRRQKL
jgi:hypothetical protein